MWSVSVCLCLPFLIGNHQNAWLETVVCTYVCRLQFTLARMRKLHLMAKDDLPTLNSSRIEMQLKTPQNGKQSASCTYHMYTYSLIGARACCAPFHSVHISAECNEEKCLFHNTASDHSIIIHRMHCAPCIAIVMKPFSCEEPPYDDNNHNHSNTGTDENSAHCTEMKGAMGSPRQSSILYFYDFA